MAEKTAIVIGASMAGLLAARVLSDHFDRVVVAERDTLPDGPDIRGGVPQARHVHALLVQGQHLLEEFFPGLSDELTESGAPRFTWCRDTCYFTPGGWIKRFDSKIQTNMIRRVELEHRIRQHVGTRPNVSFLTGRDVRGLVATDDKSRVTGIDVSVRGTQDVEQHSADLVVDCSGRGSKAPEWLTALGYDAPRETAVKSHVGYATRMYKKPADAPDWTVLFINARSAEGNPRGAAIFDVGHGEWMVSLGGLNKEYPPTDEEGFMAFARKLPSPTVAEALARAEPTSGIVGYRIEGSRLRHYDQLARRPEGFVAMGDAVCSFNPIYGQGITVAALEARELDAVLRKHGTADLTGFAGVFQKQIAKTLANAWVLATGEDLRFPGTEGDRPGFAARLIQRYVDQYARVSFNDELLTLTFIKVLNLAAPPTTLFAPHVFARVVALTFRQWRGMPISGQDGTLIPAVQG